MHRISQWFNRNSPVDQPALPDPGTIDSFIHVPKTGGSTLRTVLARQYGVGSIVYCEPSSPNWPKGVSVLDFIKAEMAKRRLGLITGHFALGVHEYTRRPVRYFSMVRDPLERELSNYYYAYSYKAHPLREAIISGSLSFETYLDRLLRNDHASQGHLLSGLYPVRGGDPAMAANHNICESLSAFGVVERFDESLLFFGKQLGWRPPLYVRRNVTRLDDEKHAERQEKLRSERKSAFAHLRTDYGLYGLANVLLNTFIKSCGAAFKLAYDSFQELQEELLKLEDKDIYREYSFDGEAPLPGDAGRLANSTPYRRVAQFLEQPIAMPTPPKNYAGYVGQRDNHCIRGWALDIATDAPIQVTGWYKNQKIATALCDVMREDVMAAGYARANVGFRLEISHDVPTHEVEVAFADSPILLRRGRS